MEQVNTSAGLSVTRDIGETRKHGRRCNRARHFTRTQRLHRATRRPRHQREEVDLHLSDLKEPTWMISECDQETKELALPVVRRLYEALFAEGRYRA